MSPYDGLQGVSKMAKKFPKAQNVLRASQAQVLQHNPLGHNFEMEAQVDALSTQPAKWTLMMRKEQRGPETDQVTTNCWVRMAAFGGHV